MRIEYDEAKRRLTLERRSLDFAEAGDVFAGDVLTRRDPRDYGNEVRWQSIGILHGREVFIAWTWRDDCRRIISMRKADGDERKLFRDYLDRS